MRTFSIWRHALFALSLLTFSSTALAAKPSEPPAKQDHPAQAHQAKGKHVKHKTAAVPKAKASSAADRVRQAKQHPAKPAAKPKAHDPKAAADHKTAPKTGKDKTAKAHGRTARRVDPPPQPKPAAPKPCLHDAVNIVRGSDNHAETLVLTRCNGRPVDGALAHFSSLIAPNLAAAPSSAKPGHKATTQPAKQLDVGLLNRIQAISSHFQGKTIRIASAYRPLASRSYHQTGRAMDLVVNGVSNEDLVAFCRTLPDTGCGFYPNSTFVHVDVRTPGTGHVYWIDASKPGEPARYVTSWPEKESSDQSASPPAGLSHDDHPAEEASAQETPPALPEKTETAPAKQPGNGDVELDSKQQEQKKAR
jgi:hypothetical protein